MSDSPGLMDTNVRYRVKLARQAGNSNYKRTVISPANLIFFSFFGGGRRKIKMTFGLVHARYSSSKWQAVKVALFAPWKRDSCICRLLHACEP